MTNSAKNVAAQQRADDQLIDKLFADVADVDFAPAPDFTARVLADAARVQAQISAAPSRKSPTIFVQLGELLGGWPAMGGLATAGVAGLWIGLAPPAELEAYAAELLGTSETIDLLGPDFTAAFEEGNDG